MLLAIIFSCFTLVTLATAKKQETVCGTCILLEDICYNITYITDLQANFRKDVIISKMAVLHPINRLYYAYEPEISDPEFYKVAYVDLDDPSSYGVVNSIKKVNNFGTFAIDQQKARLYLGGTDGVYTLDHNEGDKLSFFTSKGDTIKSIFYNGKVYFVRDGENKIIENKVISNVENDFIIHDKFVNIKNFVIDSNNNIVLLNTTGLYAAKFITGESERLSINSFIRGLTRDIEGNVYAWWLDRVYRVVLGNDIDTARLVRLGDIEGLGSMAFDNNNKILFTSGRSLFRLLPTNATIC